MDYKKLKKLFILCVLILIILILAASCSKDESINNNDESVSTITNVEDSHVFEEFDYNNLSDVQKDYIRNIYSNNVRFTEKGVEVYTEGTNFGKLSKVITSTWHDEEIQNFIPKAEYGKLDKIEYSEQFINIYINDAKKGDAKDYLKKVKEAGFTQNETKSDGDVMLEYRVYNEDGDYVKIRFMKGNKTLEIVAKKA